VKLVRYLLVAGIILWLLFLATDIARADTEGTIRKVAEEEGISADLAVSIARCESSLNHNARNGQYKGVFQMGPGWASHHGSVEDQTREFAAAVKAGSASRHWACWPRARRSSTKQVRTVHQSPPTGTDRCDRASGEWRCHPSWSKPDALTVSPTIEQDPGPWVESCSWQWEIWQCKVDYLVYYALNAQEPEVITPTDVPTSPLPVGWSWWDVLLFLVLGAACFLLARWRRTDYDT
jgi:hypothetical protein